MDSQPYVAVPLKTLLKLAGVLAVAGALATAALFPYLMVVMPETLAKIPASIPMPLVIAAQSLQALVMLGLLAFLGLLMGRRLGLGAPWLLAWIAREPKPQVSWRSAILLGLAAGVVMIALDLFFMPRLPPALQALPPPDSAVSAGVGFLASFYGAIGEEILMRLFLMTAIVFVAWLLFKRRTSPWMFWLAIVVAAVIFGAGHLPAAAKLWPLDAIVVTRVLLLNGLGGMVFGWLYWKRGLEAAMISHFSADLVLHVFAPLLSSLVP